MAISVGDAVLKLGVDTRDLDRGMKGIANTIKKHNKAIGLAMTAAGGAILAAGVLSVKTYAEMGDAVQKMALRTGFSTEALSELRHAAEISGTNLGSLEKAVKRMSGTILDAQDGLETYIRAFQHIGIEIEELDGLNPEQQFLKIAEAIAELEDPTKRAAIAQDIFGRAGTELLPLFAAGKKGLAELREEAHRLGIVFDQEAANKAAELTDAMTRMKESVSGVKMVIAEQLLPILTPLIDKIKDIIAGISAWMREHPELTRMIVLATGALGALMLVLGPLLILLPQITAAYTIMRGFMLTRLIPSIAAVTAALWAKVSALFAAMVAMGPVGWAMAATSMALIATGLVVIIKKAKDATSAFTGKVKDYIEPTRKAADVTKDLSDNLSELESVTHRISDAESKLTAVREKLSGGTAALDSQQGHLIASGFDYAKIQRLMAEANLGLKKSEDELIDILLVKIQLTNEETVFLERYIAEVEKATEVEKARQKELEKTNQLLEEQIEAYEEATKMIDDVIESMQYERSEAGRLGISIDDIIRALHLMGESNEHIAETLVNLGDEQDNVLAVMSAFELKAIDIAKILGLEADAVTTLVNAYKGLERTVPSTVPSGAAARRLPEEEGFREIGEVGRIPFSELTREQVVEGVQRGGHFWAPTEEDKEALMDFYSGGLAGGGIVMRPISARIGERAPRIPEAVIPLDKLDSLGIGGKTKADIRIYFDGREFARLLGQPLVDIIRLRTGIHI